MKSTLLALIALLPAGALAAPLSCSQNHASILRKAEALGAPMRAVRIAMDEAESSIYRRKDILAVFDIKQPSKNKRFYLLDLCANRVTAYHSAHGRGNGGGTATKFKGLDYKRSQLDTSVLLGLLHSSSSLFPLDDTRVRSTVDKLVAAFRRIYPVNQRSHVSGTALGRYPEDRYSGTNFAQGNPWVLCTLAASEYYYRLAIKTEGSLGARELELTRAKDLLQLGDTFMDRVKYHANADGSLSEQIERHTGFMTSARDLTWNYAAFITAYWARQDALQALERMRHP